MDFVNSALLKTGGLPLVDSWQVQTASNITGVKYYGGYLYACGDTPSLGSCYVYKFNTDGEVVWQKRQSQSIPPTLKIYPKGIAVNSSGVYVISTSEGYPSFLMKYDHDGSLLFSVSMRLGSVATSLVCIDASESAVVVGGYVSGDAIAVSFDNSGNINWQKKYAKTGNDYIYGLCIDPDDSDAIYVAGKTASTLVGIGGNAGLFMRLNSSGVIQVQQQWSSGAGEDFEYRSVHVTTTVDGTFGYLCGHEKDGSGIYSGVVQSCDESGYGGGSTYEIYSDGSNNIKFNSVKTVRSGATGSPRIVGSHGTTSALTLKVVSSYFIGKKFTGTHAGDEIEIVGGDTYSCQAIGTSNGSLVHMTDAVLTDAINSTWGSATVTNINALTAFGSGTSGAVSLTESVISLNTSLDPYTILDLGVIHPSNYNYSNKAV